MDFPILDLMDQDGCYHKLLDLLHPGGLVSREGDRGEGQRARVERDQVVAW